MDLIRKSAVGIGLLLCAALGLKIGYAVYAGETQDEAVAVPAATPTPTPAPAPAASIAFGPGIMRSAPAREPQPAAAAAGTSAFAVDEHGKLVVDENTEVILDGFIATLTESPGVDQWKQIEAKVRAGLPDTAAPQAVALVHAYFDYRKEDRLLAPDNDPEGLTAMRAALDQKISLRRKFFKPEVADVLFGVREAQLRYSLEVARVAADTSLDPLSKQQAIRALHAALPPKVAALEANAAERFSAELEEKIALLRVRNAPDEEIARTRAQYLQPEERKPEPAAAPQADTTGQQGQ